MIESGRLRVVYGISNKIILKVFLGINRIGRRCLIDFLLVDTIEIDLVMKTIRVTRPSQVRYRK